ncbi:hypothetical protein H5410_053570 [Solanum commersonii]|uniref:Uncharacterized protein n=1 Tax=Solanum commersonii TaxID=4109 RepID=A0A9J5X589_SOLCO|nr:hypothetical protein H5410_053570 [Solanum commersonii]
MSCGLRPKAPHESQARKHRFSVSAFFSHFRIYRIWKSLFRGRTFSNASRLVRAGCLRMG